MNTTVLKNRGFVSLSAGSAISELGGSFGTFCNSIIVYELTGSKLALGSMWLLYFLPSIVFQLVSGPFIDKSDRKWIMIFSQWTRALIFLVPLSINVPWPFGSLAYLCSSGHHWPCHPTLRSCKSSDYTDNRS